MKLSIVCLTYNHKNFINDALKSFVNQKTNFDFEVIVHDDASTDITPKIIQRYEQEYPHIIRPIYQTENQWSKRKTLSKTFVYPKITGEYVIFCEGDDYFTDMNKLQKQVDFLDANPEYSICFHPVATIWADNSQLPEMFPPADFISLANPFTFKNLLRNNFIQTNSCLYRWRFHRDDINTLMPDDIIPGDYFLHLLHAQVGKISFIPEVMSTYRRHQKGVWAGLGDDPVWYLRYGLQHINFYTEVEKAFNYSKEKDKENMADTLLLSAISLNSDYTIASFLKAYPELFQKTLKRVQKYLAKQK